MTPKERAAMQQAIEFIVDCEYGKAELALREALGNSLKRKCFADYQPNHAIDRACASCPVAAECQTGEQAERNSMFMEGYRIGLAEMREKCAKVVTEHAPTCSPHWVSYVAAIRAIKFEGDTGFRPVSEMVAEHKQAERVSMKECRHCGFLCKPNPDESRKWYPLEQPVSQEPKSDCPCCGAKSSVLPMAFCRECKSEFWPPQPIRTKDLTDEEIYDIGDSLNKYLTTFFCDFARAVIAADREKNK